MLIKKISNKEIIEFNRVFSLLLYSKIPIINSIELILKQTKNKHLSEILKKILVDLKRGNSLSKSFAKYSDIFSEIYVANLRVAEETGNIAEVISEYTDYQEKFSELKQKITNASRYPVFVILVSVGVIFFMMFFLIPSFESLFSSINSQLPPLTEFILSFSNLIIENGVIIFLFLLSLIILANFLLKNKSFQENVIDKLAIKLPFVSKLYKLNLLARFSLSMSILLKSKVSLLEALKISSKISNNNFFQKEISVMIKKLIKGESLTLNVKKSDFFDITFSKLLAAGEESAELDRVFNLISNFYNKEFDYNLSSITSLIEPVLILFVGAIVAVILVAMYLPMFEVVNYLGV
ncbi:MAG: type II secretion system F family protein [Ignavibacteria bacterium]|jgi:type IV pilus assembly protein PilC